MLLIWAFVVFVAALVSDWLDGYLARKWKVEGAFGRVVDPFADKILVLGTFIFFAGKNFIIPGADRTPGRPPDGGEDDHRRRAGDGRRCCSRASCSSRACAASCEGGGTNFGAVWAGKFKMGFQSGTILVILVYVTFRPWLLNHGIRAGRADRRVTSASGAPS